MFFSLAHTLFCITHTHTVTYPLDTHLSLFVDYASLWPSFTRWSSMTLKYLLRFIPRARTHTHTRHFSLTLHFFRLRRALLLQQVAGGLSIKGLTCNCATFLKGIFLSLSISLSLSLSHTHSLLLSLHLSHSLSLILVYLSLSPSPTI
jgi:hypothetical protein